MLTPAKRWRTIVIDKNNEHLKFYIENGCTIANLGFVKSPPGYEIMLNSDESHYFWLKEDGVESVIDWDMWAAYRGAKKHYEDSEIENEPVRKS